MQLDTTYIGNNIPAHGLQGEVNPIWTGGGGGKCPPEGFC